MPRVPRWPSLFYAGLLFVAGCTPSAGGPCDAASVTLEATVTDEAMDPSALTVCRDQEVTLRLHSQANGEFHLHGYDERLPETSLTSGATTTVEFTADAAGQFIMELHTQAGEVEIGVFTVNES